MKITYNTLQLQLHANFLNQMYQIKFKWLVPRLHTYGMQHFN